MSQPATAVAQLFEDLDRIAEEHEELTDTDVREAIHLTLNYYFVWGKPRDRFPVSFYMFSADGDQLIGGALRRFLDAAEASRELSALPVGQARLDALQDSRIRTQSGRQYDEFMGHLDEPLAARPLEEQMFVAAED